MSNKALVYRRFGAPESVLYIEEGTKAKLAEGMIRVKMLCAPVNASDLIPMTGAYQHRIALPQVAGYEGTGVVTDAPSAYRYLLSRQVLALRGEGTWQNYVDVPAALAIIVPENTEATLAARAYINPLAAKLMISHLTPAGKHVLLTAAGSDCAMLLGQWAIRAGALSVTGIHRSPAHSSRLAQCGITPVQETDHDAVRHYAARAEVVYDATGGTLAENILEEMPVTGLFISYGLLSGQPFRAKNSLPRIHWFHVRHYLSQLGIDGWQQMFREIWRQLSETETSEASVFDFENWENAIKHYHLAGRLNKPVIQFASVS
ncbi:alcohol dehydrogenase [Candidatus Pantoea deserta]|uniref:Alcohol dehydrogenase n=1 Tax=Candidatus Pantoea deserta TaxID=1869313 RepID=A0A3N4NEN4_9GAMM|nr:zinc-dependent alcohol dehydrogenase family protein [Pantoea deserta]RPD94621.1 alcohol dehydrogenase [Pantoea deserta]